MSRSSEPKVNLLALGLACELKQPTPNYFLERRTFCRFWVWVVWAVRCRVVQGCTMSMYL